MKRKALWIEMVVFVLLFAISISSIYGVLRYKNTGSGGGTDNFYNTKVPIDAIFFGSSHAACTVNNGVLWSEYGIASFTLSAGAQKGEGTAYFVKEAIAHNKPKVALVETYLLLDESFALDSFYRSALTTKFSGRLIDYVTNVGKKNNFDRETLENILLRMPIVHARYNELTRDDFCVSEEYVMGYRGSNECTPLDPLRVCYDQANLASTSLECVDEIIKVCNENNVEAVFFAAPYSADIESQMRQNTLKSYVEGKGCVYLDYLEDYQTYGIDFESDFRDYEHLNDTGAEKITRAIGDILKDNYSLPDRRGQKGYEHWDWHVRYLADKQLGYELQQYQESSEYLPYLADKCEDFTFILSLNGNFRALGDDLFWPVLSGYGLSFDDYEKGGVFVIQSGELKYNSGELTSYKYNLGLNNTEFNIYKSDADEFVNIRVGDKDCSPDCNGVSLITFDDTIGYAIDSVKVDVYSGSQIIRNIESN